MWLSDGIEWATNNLGWFVVVVAVCYTVDWLVRLVKGGDDE